MNTPGRLVDKWGRVHDELRLSVTDRCNLRCLYCVGEQPVRYRSRSALLSYEEIVNFVNIVSRLGIRRIRLTGGEPLVRKDLSNLVAALAAIEDIEDISLTTNGSLLSRWALPLKAAGLRRVNISLDCLCPRKYRWLTGGELAAVLSGIEASCEAGFEQIKINAVAIRDFSEAEIIPLANFARKLGATIRFIELMPTSDGNPSAELRPLPADEILAILEAEYGKLRPLAHADPSGPATVYQFPDGNGVVGIIPALTRPFCHRCNRLRLSADGKLRTCLFSREEWDIRTLLKQNAPAEAIVGIVRAALDAKWQHRPYGEHDKLRLPVPMYRSGG